MEGCRYNYETFNNENMKVSTSRLVSVATLVYDFEKYSAECIESVLGKSITTGNMQSLINAVPMDRLKKIT